MRLITVAAMPILAQPRHSHFLPATQTEYWIATEESNFLSQEHFFPDGQPTTFGAFEVVAVIGPERLPRRTRYAAQFAVEPGAGPGQEIFVNRLPIINPHPALLADHGPALSPDEGPGSLPADFAQLCDLSRRVASITHVFTSS